MNKKPTLQDSEVLKLVVEKLWPEIKKWMINDASLIEESYKEEYFQEIINSIELKDDAYDIARYLEIHYDWDPDVDLVYILDQVFPLKLKFLRDLSIKWMQENNVEFSKFKVGDKVKADFHGKIVDGEIIEIHDHGKYTICCSLLGHVKEGKGVRGIIFEYEDIIV